MPQIVIDGRPVFWREAGFGEPVIFLMGLETDHRGWYRVVPQLKDRLRCVSIDNRDVGKSGLSLAPYTIADMARDVLAVVDSLSLEKFSLVGQSMGGAIAQEVARQQPGRVRSMVLISSFAALPQRSLHALAGWKQLKAMLSPRDYYPIIMPWMYTLEQWNDRDLMRVLIDRAAANPEQQPPEAFSRQVDAIAGFDSRGWLATIEVQSLVISGVEDLITPPQSAEELHRLLPDSELMLISACGHALAMTEDFGRAIPRMADFLQFQTERGGAMTDMIGALSSTMIRVDDMNAACSFYTEIMGFKLKFRDGDRWAALDAGGTTLALAAADEFPGGADGTAINVKVADINSAVERSLRGGALLVQKPTTTAHETRAAVRDRNGHLINFYMR